ncbi:hypothetical protein E2C01_042446 [Portunus trituberculatus]|uniref:Uncharacterized protein n=1 Tax=Portunus trituberculatus TaxID=210409 RepID=A0A5B7FWI6_PORTR|nr:hypothetical protein [Portunus trituberculatus]
MKGESVAMPLDYKNWGCCATGQTFAWLLGVCEAGRGRGGHGVRESGAQEACVEEGGYLKTKITLIVTHNYKQILANRLSHKKAMKLSGRHDSPSALHGRGFKITQDLLG